MPMSEEAAAMYAEFAAERDRLALAGDTDANMHAIFTILFPDDLPEVEVPG